MRRLITALVLLVGAFALIGAPSAFADTFNWSFTSSGGDSGSGTFTATEVSAGVELITGITGTWDGSSIAGLIAPGNYPSGSVNGTCCSVPGNNNLLYYPGSPALDLGGLGFASNGNWVNVYWSGSYLVLTDVGECCYNPNSPGTPGALTTSSAQNGNFSIVSTPEPATLGLLGASLILLVFVSKQRS